MQPRMVEGHVLVALTLTCLPVREELGVPQNEAQPAPSATHVVQLVGPNGSGFETALDTDFPGLRGVKYFQAIERLLVIVSNPGPRDVKAYVVRWTITNGDGSTNSVDLPVMWQPDPGGWPLTGQQTVLEAGATKLVSPFFHWTKQRFPRILAINAAWILLQGASRKPLVASVQNAASVQVTLDGVVFGDGVFTGPDTSDLYERFESEQKAEVDEGMWMLNRFSSGTAAEQIREGLSQQIYEGRNAAGADLESLYAAARGREATRLLGVLDQRGQTVLQNVAARLARANPMTLSKQAAQ